MSKSKTWLKISTASGLVLIPIIALASISAVCAYWLFDVDRISSSLWGENFIVLHSQPPVEDRKFYGFAASLLPLCLWNYALYRLFMLFYRYNQNQVLVRALILDTRAFAASCGFAVISGFLLSGVMRWSAGVFDNGPLWTHLGFSTTHGALLLCSLILYLASHIIEEGYRCQQENSEFV